MRGKYADKYLADQPAERPRHKPEWEGWLELEAAILDQAAQDYASPPMVMQATSHDGPGWIGFVIGPAEVLQFVASDEFCLYTAMVDSEDSRKGFLNRLKEAK